MTQEFCPRCDNLLYERTNPTSLTLTCRNCNYEREAKEARLISFTTYGDDKGAFDDRQLAQLARHLVHDPTLPRVNNIPCPNKACPATRDGKWETLYNEVDAVKLQFVYVCERCRTAWRGGVKRAEAAEAAADSK